MKLTEGCHLYSTDTLRECPLNPRRRVDPVKLQELADSIRANGIIEPLVVREIAPIGTLGKAWEVVAGTRRLQAAKLVGLLKVPVVIRRNLSDREALELILVENLQREDLNPIEQARAFRQLMDDYGYTQQQCATRIGCSQGAVSAALQLLGAPRDIQQSVAKGELAPSAVRAVSRWVKDPTKVERILREAPDATCAVLAEKARVEADRPAPPRKRIFQSGATLAEACASLVRAVEAAAASGSPVYKAMDRANVIAVVLAVAQHIRASLELPEDPSLGLPVEWVKAREMRDAGKTQAEIAGEFGVSQVAVSMWLRNLEKAKKA